MSNSNDESEKSDINTPPIYNSRVDLIKMTDQDKRQSSRFWRDLGIAEGRRLRRQRLVNKN